MPYGRVVVLRLDIWLYRYASTLNFAVCLSAPPGVGQYPQPPSRSGETVGDASGKEIDMDRLYATPYLPRTSFEEMVRPHLKSLYALAWRFTHNTALAQDLVQDTMLKAYRFFHRFETGTNFWAWLATIMRNLYFSHVRRQSRQAIVMDIDRLPLPAPSGGADDLIPHAT